MDKPKTIVRTHMLRVKVSRKEHAAILAAAELSSLTISSYCRMIIRKTAAADLHAAGKAPDL